MRNLKDNFLLYLSFLVLGFCAYITIYGVIPFTEIKYQVTLTDSILFVALYIVLQMTFLLYMDRASSRIQDIVLSIISFVVINFFFSLAEVGHLLELYNYFNKNTDFIAHPQKFAAFSINIALLVDLTFINIFNILYLRRIDHFTHDGAAEAEERINKEQKAKEEKKKADAQKRAKEIEKQQKQLDNELVIAKSNS